jgi:hypothetical protein
MIARLFTLRGVIFMFGVVIIGTAIVIVMLPKLKPVPSMPDASTIEYISSELDRRNVDSCVLEPIDGGWKCTTQDGKVYKVHR